MTDRPEIRLRPKMNATRIRHGAPWVYDNELVLDRRTRKIAPGTMVDLLDADRNFLAVAAFNASSKIAARIFSRTASDQINEDWLTARLAHANALRERLYDAPYYRLIHAEGDGLPGLVIDRFGEALAIQPNAAWAEAMLPELTRAAQQATGATVLLKNASGRARGLEGLDDVSELLVGKIDGPVPVPMNGATYLADLTGGQKTGLFYDQRPNHAFVARLARDTRVLDVFSHVGGFALAALAGGARSALCVDGSAPALDLARQGAAASGVADRFDATKGDAFATLEELAASGESFETVICDPPAFAPAKSALPAGLRAYERIARLGAGVTAPGGTLTLCSCSHAADLSAFRAACTRGIGKAGRQGQLLRTGFAGPDHPIHPALSETAYLKALTFRLV